MPKKSDTINRRRVAEAVKASLREILGNAIVLGWVLALVAAGWYFYQRSSGRSTEVTEVPWIESQSAGLVSALEKYRAEKGEYPKYLRDLTTPPNKFGLNFIYGGVDRVSVISDACAQTPWTDECWTGYRGYGLSVVSKSKTYTYDSSAKRWQEEAPQP